MIKLNALAKDIQSKLEDISFGIGEEENFIQFSITDDIQIYQNTNLKKNNRTFTPGILRQIPGGFGPDQQWGVYSAQYQLEVYGYRKERNELREVFGEFIRTYNGNDYVPELGYDVFEDDRVGVISLGEFIIDDYDNSNDGTNTNRLTGYLDIMISVFVGGLSAKETSIKIEGVEIPFDEIQYKQDKSLVSTLPLSNMTENPHMDNKLIYELLTLNIPFKIDNNVDMILGRILDKTFNDEFEIEWELTEEITKKDKYVVRSAFVQYNQMNEAIGVLVSFENTTETQKILIDGEEMIVLDFNFSSVRGTEAFNTSHEDGNIEVLQVNTTYSYGISLSLLYNNNSEVFKNLRSDVLNRNLDTSHILTIVLDDEHIDHEVILIDGTWSFNERANQVLQISLVGEKKI